jgi:hypothetical protein
LRQKLPDINIQNPIKIFPGKELLQFCSQQNIQNKSWKQKPKISWKQNPTYCADERRRRAWNHPTEERPKWRTAWTTDSPRIPMPTRGAQKTRSAFGASALLLGAPISARSAISPAGPAPFCMCAAEREREVVGVVVVMMI